MSENIISTAEHYSDELDRVFTSKSATAFLADNALRTKFVGAKTVMIPDVNFDGLADYDRSTGFTDGAVNVSHNTYTMAMDRARSFSIDSEDMDETGVASLAGKILGEYVRTKVVPECDAYVLSKLAQTAEKRGNLITGVDISAPFSAFSELVNNVQSVAGYDEEIVCFVDSEAYAALCASDEFTRMITISDFKQGDINLKVKSINGVAIIPVVGERMNNKYQFSNDGFELAGEVSHVYMIAMPKSAAHLVKKTEKMRVFTPDQNTSADAYKFDYRIYYDVFVKESAADAVWAWESDSIFVINLGVDSEVIQGQSDTYIDIIIDMPYTHVSYTWYKCEDKYRRGSQKLEEYTDRFLIPSSTPKGTYYYYCKVNIKGVTTILGNVCEIKVK